MNAFRIMLVFLFIFKMQFSQSAFAPINSYFTYNFISHDGGTTGIKTLYYNSDTTINSVVFKKICSAVNYHCVCPNPSIVMSYCNEYILERNDSLFQYFPNQDTIQCLYAFNSSIGDSIVFNSTPQNLSFRYKIILDSIGTKFICGQNRQIMYYTKYQDICSLVSMPVTIVKGIGPIDDYLFSQTNGCELGIGNYNFNCINTGICSYPSGVCISEALSVKEDTTSDFKIFISYNLNNIQIHFENILDGSIFIRNILGNSVYESEFKNQSFLSFPFREISNGIYLVSVMSSDNRKIVTQKIVVQ